MQNIEQQINRLQALNKGVQKAFHIFQREPSNRNKRRWRDLERQYRIERQKGFV